MRFCWTKLALKDLQNVWDYIALDNPRAASRMLERIKKATESLLAYKNLGRAGRIRGTRELVVIGTPFVIPYRIKENRIEILAVIHGSRRWPDEL